MRSKTIKLTPPLPLQDVESVQQINTGIIFIPVVYITYILINKFRVENHIKNRPFLGDIPHLTCATNTNALNERRNS